MILCYGIAWIGLIGCTRPIPDPAFCEAKTAYAESGVVDATAYQVSRACLRWMNARLDACHKE